MADSAAGSVSFRAPRPLSSGGTRAAETGSASGVALAGKVSKARISSSSDRGVCCGWLSLDGLMFTELKWAAQVFSGAN